jgi:DinB superfamily
MSAPQTFLPASIQTPIAMLEKTPGILEMLLRDIAPDVLAWKPAPERWSIAEVLAHMAVLEKLYEQRARRMVREDSPVLAQYIPPAEIDVLGRPARRHLEEFVALRRAFVFYLHSVPASAATRVGMHHELGAVTLSQMLHELANHDLGHLRQIAELYRAHSFYPQAGPFQKYSHPKP